MTSIVKQSEQQLRKAIEDAVQAAIGCGELPNESLPEFTVETPADRTHGDLAANAAMVSARAFRMPPRRIADTLMQHLSVAGTCFEKAEVAGPGFINFYLNPDWIYGTLSDIEQRGKVVFVCGFFFVRIFLYGCTFLLFWKGFSF